MYPPTVLDTSEWGLKIRFLSCNFYATCKNTTCSYDKNLKIFRFVFGDLCAISIIPLVVCVWFIFKHNFDLHDVPYRYQSSLTK
jgi:hypothetical protein